jgi:hypothetical protein
MGNTFLRKKISYLVRKRTKLKEKIKDKGERKMKVKVGDKIYDGDKKPVMIILTDEDKKNIANMLPECTRYCEFPEEGYSVEEIKEWMRKPPKEDWELKKLKKS